MSHKIVGVVFATKSQDNAPGRFTVPTEVCTALGIGPPPFRSRSSDHR